MNPMAKKSIPEILEAMFKTGNEDLYIRNATLAFELLEAGPSAVDQVLDRLIFLAKTGGMIAADPKSGYPVMHLISAISMMAKPLHAGKVAELLVSDEIISDGRARRGPLVRTLGRIGSREAIKALDYYRRCITFKKYPEFVFENSDRSQILFPEAENGKLPASHLKSADLDEVEQAIAAISERT